MSAPSFTLAALARGLPDARLQGDGSAAVLSLTGDSREVAPGCLFVALRGTRVDGHRFVDGAARAGASAVVVEDPQVIPPGLPALVVGDTREALAHLAARFYGDASAAMPVVGLTGTNGKTTTSYILEAILAAAGGSPIVMGTVSFRHAGWERPATHTTPDPITLARILAERREAGATHAVLEVSSHALDQRRADGLRFDVAAFTNLSREHLEYHPDMEAYFQAKARLFTELLPRGKGPRASVVCVEDAWGRRLASMLQGGPVLTYGLKGAELDIAPTRAQLDLAGISATVRTPAGEVDLESPLVGEHNLLNVLAAVGCGVALGIPLATLAAGIAALKRVPGRLDPVGDGPLRVFVDYAHSPDALSHVGAELKRLSAGRLLTVFGCAGDRDPGKRPLMAEAAWGASDAVVITSDNPRSEDPVAICAAVAAGIPAGATRVDGPRALGSAPRGAWAVEVDRATAIREAIAGARPGDTVLIAGKGHETYQIVGAERRSFDDREVASQALAAREGR